eukprot:scaffold1156_cov394-Prasinococcus_capsulatus_cf.AAC.25
MYYAFRICALEVAEFRATASPDAALPSSAGCNICISIGCNSQQWAVTSSTQPVHFHLLHHMTSLVQNIAIRWAWDENAIPD